MLVIKNIRLYSAIFGRLLDPRFSSGVMGEAWILDPAEYRILDCMQEVLKNQGAAWTFRGDSALIKVKYIFLRYLQYRDLE